MDCFIDVRLLLTCLLAPLADIEMLYKPIVPALLYLFTTLFHPEALPKHFRLTAVAINHLPPRRAIPHLVPPFLNCVIAIEAPYHFNRVSSPDKLKL